MAGAAARRRTAAVLSAAAGCGAVPCYRGRGRNASATCLAARRAAAASGCTFTADTDFTGASWGDTQSGVTSAKACCAACVANPDCAAGVWQSSSSRCYLKGGPIVTKKKSGVQACVARPVTPVPPPSAANQTLSFDLSKTTHAVEGFGAQVWADQKYGYEEFKALNIKYIRMTQDTATMAEMRQLRKVTDSLDIEWVYVLWSAPDKYVGRDGMLSDVAGFAAHWVATVKELDAGGVRPHYLDLMNEPNSGGDWSTGIAPADFSALVKAVRAGLDAAGYRDVGITGPGLAALDYFGDSQKWISALDKAAVAALSAWASHMWDDGAVCHGGSSCVRSAWAKGFGPAIAASRGGAAKRAWVTEFATKEVDLHGAKYPLPDDTAGYSSASTMAYAARVYQNTVALLGAGASAAFYWEAEDEPAKSWGYVTRRGEKKPVYQALLALLPKIPRGARVAAPPPARASGEEGVSAGVFVGAGGGAVVVAVANDAAAPRSATIELRGAGAAGLGVSEATAVLLGKRGSAAKGQMDTAKTESRDIPLLPTDGSTSFSVTLPADSTLTVVLA